MRKLTTVILVLFLSLLCLSAMSVFGEGKSELLSSKEMLDRFFILEELAEDEEEFWNSVKVSLVTVGRGDPLFTYFGHSAIFVEIPDVYSAMFNWGSFRFDKSFYLNFAIGNLKYRCVGFYEDYEYAKYTMEQRTMTKVLLNLTSEQKKALTDFLEVNTDDYYSTYDYKIFDDNCSTRIRDIIDLLTDGEFRTWAQNIETGTLRKQLARVVSASSPLSWCLNSIAGRKIDKQISLWDAMFLPEVLESAVIEYGKLGSEKEYLLDYSYLKDRQPISPEPEGSYLSAVFAGLLIAAIAVLTVSTNKGFALVSGVFDMILGLFGTAILFLMIFTRHDFSYWNENILIMNPFIIRTALLSFRYHRNYSKLKKHYFAYTLITFMLVALKLIFREVFIQDNIVYIVIVLPYYIVCWFSMFIKERRSVEF